MFNYEIGHGQETASWPSPDELRGRASGGLKPAETIFGESMDRWSTEK